MSNSSSSSNIEDMNHLDDINEELERIEKDRLLPDQRIATNNKELSKIVTNTKDLEVAQQLFKERVLGYDPTKSQMLKQQ